MVKDAEKEGGGCQVAGFSMGVFALGAKGGFLHWKHKLGMTLCVCAGADGIQKKEVCVCVLGGSPCGLKPCSCY